MLLQGPAPSGRNRWIARAPWQAPDVDGVTRVSGLPAAARAGDFATVRITAVRAFDLGAEVVGGRVGNLTQRRRDAEKR